MDGEGRRIDSGDEPPAPAARVSHGICQRCVASLAIDPVPDLHRLTCEEYDQLPFGVIEVDAEGTVLAYNAWEESLTSFDRDRVRGRNFFSDIAPCTKVREFRGRFRDMVGRDEPARREISFLFTLPTGDRKVGIVMVWHPTFESGLILVRDAEAEQ